MRCKIHLAECFLWIICRWTHQKWDSPSFTSASFSTFQKVCRNLALLHKNKGQWCLEETKLLARCWFHPLRPPVRPRSFFCYLWNVWLIQHSLGVSKKLKPNFLTWNRKQKKFYRFSKIITKEHDINNINMNDSYVCVCECIIRIYVHRIQFLTPWITYIALLEKNYKKYIQSIFFLKK